MVPKLGEVLTRDKHLNHGTKVDDELRGDNEVEDVAFVLACTDELEHVHAKGNSREGRTHDAGGLSEIFPFHGENAVLEGKACLMLSETVGD